MSLSTGTVLSRTVVFGFMLSFVGAQGCLGGNVSLGNDEGGSGGLANGTAGSNTGTAGRASGSSGTDTGAAGSNAVITGGAGSAGSNGVITGIGNVPKNPTLTVSNGGQVSNSAFAVAGSLYSASDGVSADGTNPSGGDCELAGHSPSDCAAVTTPAYSAPGVIDWSASGLICTSGVVERVLDLTNMTGTPDYASMWGSAIGFDFQELNGQARPYDATEYGVVGIAFDIDAIPLPGLRVELLTETVQNEPAAWQASAAGGSYVSPLQPGHNVVLFSEVKPLPFYDVQAVFDPTQLLSVQFHIPTTTANSAMYRYCISNVSLVVSTP